MKPENWLTIDLSVDGCLSVALHASTFYDLRPGNGAGPILTTPRAHTGQQQSEVFCASLHIYMCDTVSAPKTCPHVSRCPGSTTVSSQHTARTELTGINRFVVHSSQTVCLHKIDQQPTSKK